MSDKSRRSGAPWANQSSRRDDKRRDHRDDFDEFLEKKRRELMDFKEENDRLRADRNSERAENDRLRAELRKRDADLANLEQQWQDASERQTKRAKAALEKLVEVFVAPAKSEDGDSTDPSNDQGDGAGDEEPLRPTLPEDTNTAATGPGEAAPLPTGEDGGVKDGDKAQEDALEAAVRCRSDVPAA